MNDNNKNLIIASLVVAAVAGYYFYNKGLAAAAANAAAAPATPVAPATVVTPTGTMTIPVMPMPVPATSQVALTDANYEAILDTMTPLQLQNINNEAQVFINNKGLHNSWTATCETNYCETTSSSLSAIQPNLKQIIYAINNGMSLPM